MLFYTTIIITIIQSILNIIMHHASINIIYLVSSNHISIQTMLLILIILLNTYHLICNKLSNNPYYLQNFLLLYSLTGIGKSWIKQMP